VSPDGPTEERVIWNERFQGEQQLAFTSCVFKDCNIDKLEPDEERGLYVKDNFFDRPLEERRAEFERRLVEVLGARKAKKK
jgi:hypothetical protein